MKFLKPFIFLLILLNVSSCLVTKVQKKGTIYPKNFNYETEFTTIPEIIIPVEINGVSRNFLFDTGADFNAIQRDSTFGKIYKISGASKRKVKMGEEYVQSMKIGNVDFKNTYAKNGDFAGLKELIPNFGGIIGQPIISKANWLIDYPNKRIRISNQNLADNSFNTIRIKRKHGVPYTYISINGFDYKVMIDLGSSYDCNLPEKSKLAKQLLEQYDFDDKERNRYTLGGLQKVKEKAGIVPLIKLGSVDFKNVKTKINVSSKPRIGIWFFKDCIIYIDNIEHNYKIKK